MVYIISGSEGKGMEQKFIIQHPVTFEMYKEWAKNPITSNAIEKRKKGIRLRVTGCAVSVFLIVIGILSEKLYSILIGAVFIVFYLWRLFFMPNRIIKKGYDSILKVLNSSQWIRTITLSDKIIVEDGKTNINFEYSEISKITEGDNYFNLFFNADIALRVPKDSFTSGSPDEFREFINKAAINKTESHDTEEDDLGL